MGDILSLTLSTMMQTALVGEWSEIGMCDEERIVFTSTGKTFEIKKKINKWKYSEVLDYSVNDSIIAVTKDSGITETLMKVETMTLGSIDYCKSENNSWNCSNENYLEKCEER